MSLPTITFIGLGNMGAPMAANLIRHGYPIYVFDLKKDAVEALCQKGAQTATSPNQTAPQSDIIISMLPAGQHVCSLYLGNEQHTGLFANCRTNSLIVDCSTIATEEAQKLGTAAAEFGLNFLDAPVSGGIGGAQSGTLSFMVGGSTDAVQAATPILQAMGQHIFHAGPLGAGQTAKICNNLLLSILMVGTAEALALGVQNGLNAQTLSAIMQQSSGSNWVLDRYNPYPHVLPNSPASQGYQTGFFASLMAKDLGLAQQLARQSHSATPLAQQANQQYQHLIAQHGGNIDFSAVITQYLPEIVTLTQQEKPA